MKQLLTLLLLLCSLTVSAQTKIITGPKKQQQTETVDKKKQQEEQQRKAAAEAEAKRKEQQRRAAAEAEAKRKEQQRKAAAEAEAKRKEQARQEQLRREQAQREEQARQEQLQKEREEQALQERLRYGNGHDWVDLGLSVKWATTNVGASSPTDYGGYFAWGETRTKNSYEWSTYKWCKGSYKTLTKYSNSSSLGIADNKTTLEHSDDAAHVNWGGNWRMPTKAEMDELLEKCNWTWTTLNGVQGYKVSSKRNGNSIFLPAAGARYLSSLYGAGWLGYYWSSSLGSSSDQASLIIYDLKKKEYICYDRYAGYSVRAVCP